MNLNSECNCFVSVHISSPSKKEIAAFLKKISSQEPSLYVVDVDVPLNILCNNDEKLEQVALGREFHISLGRTVPLRVHQIDSMVSMLRQKLQTQHQWVFVSLYCSVMENGIAYFCLHIYLIIAFYFSFWCRYWIDFNEWEVFVNDDNTRTFLSVEVLQGGLVEVWLAALSFQIFMPFQFKKSIENNSVSLSLKFSQLFL